MALAPGTRLGPYEVVAPLGAGGMGEVYRALDTRLRREVAVKVLPAGLGADPDRLRRFELEARAAGALNHPNLLAVYDVGTHEGAPYVVSELLEGETLRARLRGAAADTGVTTLAHEPVPVGVPMPTSPGGGGPAALALREAVEVACQIAQGLGAAHEKGIVHRDVKPENVFLRADGFVKVLDFGLAKAPDPPRAGAGPAAATAARVDTGPGVVMGTPRYMSPEQARGLAVDARTDVFGIGVVLYEMIAGRPPFDGATYGDLLVAVLEREHEPLAARRPCPDALERIVARALAKDAGRRFATAAEMARELRELGRQLDAEALFGAGASPGPAPRHPSGAARARRTRRAIDSLAVLPLANASPDPGAEYLSDGITESIINALAQLPKLRVLPRSTVFRYKGREVDATEAGRELGVRAVLTGRVLRVGDQLVVKAELVDAANEEQLWGDQYARRLTDIFALQEEISREISEQLRLKLSGDEKKKLARRQTENLEAYHLYLRGRYCVNKRTQDSLRRAIGYFQEALDLDPNYALAYAGLADSYGLLASATGGLPPLETYPRAKAAALRALELDDTLGEAHTALGFFHLLHDWDWAAAGREFRRAIELNPNYPSAHDGYGFYCKVTGRHDEAIAACARALALDPLSLFLNGSLGWAHYFARDYARAIELGRRALELDPGFGFAYWNVGLAHEAMGEYEEAVECFRRGIATVGPTLTFRAHLGRACALAGLKVDAQVVLDDLRAERSRRYVSAYYDAIVHFGLGEADRGFEWLGRACDERAGFLAFIGVEPMFDAVRGDARFAEVLRRVGLGGAATAG